MQTFNSILGSYDSLSSEAVMNDEKNNIMLMTLINDKCKEIDHISMSIVFLSTLTYNYNNSI